MKATTKTSEISNSSASGPPAIRQRKSDLRAYRVNVSFTSHELAALDALCRRRLRDRPDMIRALIAADAQREGFSKHNSPRPGKSKSARTAAREGACEDPRGA